MTDQPRGDGTREAMMETAEPVEQNEVTKLAIACKTDPSRMGELWDAIKSFAIRQVRRHGAFGDREIFDDLMQEAYLASVDAVHRFKPERGKAFLTAYEWSLKNRIRRGRRQMVDMIRVPSRYDDDPAMCPAELIELAGQAKQVTYSEVTLAFVPSRCNPVADAVIAAEAVEIVMRRVGMLPEEYRTILVQHYGIDGHAPKQISEVAKGLGCSETTARGRLFRAMEWIRGEIPTIGLRTSVCRSEQETKLRAIDAAFLAKAAEMPNASLSCVGNAAGLNWRQFQKAAHRTGFSRKRQVA